MLPNNIWIYLTNEPLIWLVITLGAFLIGTFLFKASGEKPLVNPVLIAIVLISALLLITGKSYQTYFEGAQFVHFLLGPATVALAVPLYDNRHHIQRCALPILAALLVGSVTTMLTGIGIGWALGLEGETLLSLVPRAATTPVAIGIAEKIGGLPSLTATMVILSGIFGAVIATGLFNVMGVRDYRARGFAAGVTLAGIGTARALAVNPVAGAFAGVGMGLNALLTAVLAPIVIAWLF